MRVIRRTRPSQVGCSSSASRRRILFAATSSSRRPSAALSIPAFSPVIQIDAVGAISVLREPARYEGAPVAGPPASARGR
jgi:hypothetical protein